MTTLNEIQTVHWQPQLGGDGVVTGVADIDQAIHIILTTPKGSDLLRPKFGSDVFRYLDYPINRARPHIVRETIDAIRQWEPRITAVSVQVYPAQEGCKLLLRVQYQVDSSIQNTEVRYV